MKLTLKIGCFEIQLQKYKTFKTIWKKICFQHQNSGNCWLSFYSNGKKTKQNYMSTQQKHHWKRSAAVEM